jgi:hypothetical protein
MIKNNGRSAVILGLSLLILLAATPTPGQAQTKLRVSAEIANIRQKPDIGSAIVLQLPRDTILTTVSRQGDWYLVSLVTEDRRTVTGYVHISLVSAAEPGQAEETTEGTGAVVSKPRPTTLPPRPPPTGSPVSVYSPAARFALSLTGGGEYLLGGDLNKAAQGRADYYGDFKGIEGSPEVSPAHIGYVFGGEFLVPLVDRLSLGLGLDYLKSQRSSIVLFQKGTVTNIFTCQPEMYAYPLRLFIAYSPLQSFYIKVGLEYYFAGCKYFYRTESGTLWTEWSGTATTQGLGAMAGIGLEWNLSGSLAFVLELTGHYAPLSGFKGTGTKTDRLGTDEIETGTLYYFELKSLGGTSFPQVDVRSKVPSEAGVFNAREAEVDFTRLALKTGFKVRF